MRIQKAIRLVNKEMKKFYRISVIDYSDLSSLKCFLKRDAYKALKQLEQRCEKQELFWEKEFSLIKDNKNILNYIEPYYKDALSVRDILCQVNYISDRWCCAGRIKFLLRVLEGLK